jgi:hypothetical protein
MLSPHTLTPHTVRNWRLLEREITDALCQQGVKIERNAFGDQCVSGINIATLAQVLCEKGVEVGKAWVKADLL